MMRKIQLMISANILTSFKLICILQTQAKTGQTTDGTTAIIGVLLIGLTDSSRRPSTSSNNNNNKWHESIGRLNTHAMNLISGIQLNHLLSIFRPRHLSRVTDGRKEKVERSCLLASVRPRR